MNLYNIHERRKGFINDNKNKDHAIITGNNNILISAPHGVSQVRLGRFKCAEIGSLATALRLKDTTDCYLIAKTKNNKDDANFDVKSKYKDSIRKLIKNNNIKYIIDFHGLAQNRECDVNLGTHLGKNIENNEIIFEALKKDLENNHFNVSVDQPFMGGNPTISGTMKNEFDHIWTLQIEINCGITNKKENFEKFKTLLLILQNWIKKLN